MAENVRIEKSQAQSRCVIAQSGASARELQPAVNVVADFFMKKLFKVKRLPFIQMYKTGLDSWEKMKQSSERYAAKISAIPATFVNIYELKEKARCFEKYRVPSIWIGEPALMSKSWVTEDSIKKELNYRFGTGIYCRADGILLVDDVFEWAYRRISSNDVRSALDLIVSINAGELEI